MYDALGWLKEFAFIWTLGVVRIFFFIWPHMGPSVAMVWLSFFCISIYNRKIYRHTRKGFRIRVGFTRIRMEKLFDNNVYDCLSAGAKNRIRIKPK